MRRSEKWQMSFRLDECRVMHFGSRNYHHTYNMRGKFLQVTHEQSDLEVTLGGDLKKRNGDTVFGFIITSP